MKPGKSGRYVLERVLPNGTMKAHPAPMSLRDATVAAAYVLFDNGAASKAEAQTVSPRLAVQPVGEWLDAFGYRFRLVAS